MRDREEKMAADKLKAEGLIEKSKLTALINSRSQLIKEKELLLSTEQDESRKPKTENSI